MTKKVIKQTIYAIGVLVAITLAYVFLYTPTNWNYIKIGMTKTQVIQLSGEPTFDSGDIKGCFWRFGVAPIIFELNVYFDLEEVATSVDVRQYLGPKDGEYIRKIRYETKRKT